MKVLPIKAPEDDPITGGLLNTVSTRGSAMLTSEVPCNPKPNLTTGVVPLGPEVEAAPKAADCRGALFKAHRSTIRNVGTTSKRSAAGQVRPHEGPEASKEYQPEGAQGLGVMR